MGEPAESALEVKTTGSKLLLPVSEFLGFPLDQVRNTLSYFVYDPQADHDASEQRLSPYCHVQLCNSLPN